MLQQQSRNRLTEIQRRCLNGDRPDSSTETTVCSPSMTRPTRWVFSGLGRFTITVRAPRMANTSAPARMTPNIIRAETAIPSVRTPASTLPSGERGVTAKKSGWRSDARDREDLCLSMGSGGLGTRGEFYTRKMFLSLGLSEYETFFPYDKRGEYIIGIASGAPI